MAIKALPFLAEADEAYCRCRSAGAGELLNTLDNYGYLQLDLCWVYALMGDPDYLPDAERRLAIAERLVVSKLEDHFLAMAEVHAERGATLPPTVVQVARFWLLRGLARRARDPKCANATNDLRRSALFVQQLQVDPTAVAQLVAMGATPKQATAALRRAEGIPDRAASEWLTATQERRAAGKRRAQQLKLGQTADGSFVNLEVLAQLTDMGFARRLAIAALKQCNNKLDDALSALTSKSAEALLGKTNETDRKSRRKAPVDEVALATLLSMGFDRKAAELALRSCGNDVERAIMHATDPANATMTRPPSENGESAAEGDSDEEEGEGREDSTTPATDEVRDRRAADQIA